MGDVWCERSRSDTIVEGRTPAPGRPARATEQGGSMADQTEADAEGVDFVLVAYREEGVWQVEPLAEETASDIDRLADELRRWPGDGGCLGLVSVDEDFFVLVRVAGARTRVLLSDVTAATDWPLARSAVDYLELPIPDDEDEPVPAGDPGIVADLGMGPMDMGALLDDYELYPDEMLNDIAGRLGFRLQFNDALGVAAP
jgi:putative tRNA adenosine deaminase-associated protein